MAGLYENFQAKLAPGWLQGPNGAKVETSLGAEKDDFQDRVRQGVLANLPGQAPSDAIDAIGSERQLPRVAAEADGVYAERLRTTWDSVDGWSYAGSHGSLLRALARAGLPMGTPAGAHIIQRTKRYSYLASGVVTFANHTGWTFDWRPASIWNQFGVLFGADVSGLSAGSPLAQILTKTVLAWKPAKARYMGCWVVVSGPTWDWPIGANHWNDGGLLWADGTTTGVTRFIPPR